MLICVIMFGIFCVYETQTIRRWNAEQKQFAIEQLKRNAHCPEEVIQLDREESFLDLKDAGEKVFTPKNGPVTWGKKDSKLRLFFQENPKKASNSKVVLNGRSIRLRSDKYVTIFRERAWTNPVGIILKVRASGRGRIIPYIYCIADKENRYIVPDRQIEHSSCRISSFMQRDYYFSFSWDSMYKYCCVGIQMRGNLNISLVSVCCGKDRRNKNIAVVSAQVQERSEIPDPKTSPYPDCLHTLKMKTLQVEKGKNIPPEFILVVPSFKNRELTPESKWKPSDMMKVSMIRFQEECETVRRIQQSDTLEDFDSERYSLVYTIPPRKIYCLDNGVRINLPFTKKRKYISGYDRPQNPPLTSREAAARKQRIATELNRMKDILKTMPASPRELNRQFEKIWKKNRKKYQHTEDGIYWCREGKSFFALGELQSFVDEKDISPVVQSIKDLSDYLLVHGISMITVICPNYYDISARMMNPEFSGLPDYNAARIVRQLLEQGVETLYISDEILAHGLDYDLLFHYPSDPHPAYGTQQMAARRIAGYVRKAFPEICRKQYRPEQFTEKPTLYPIPDSIRQQKQNLWKIWFPADGPFYPQILLDGKLIQPDSRSPIMLYGNSFLHSPEQLPQQQLVSELTRELNMGVGSMYRAWIHPLTTMTLELLKDPDKYLKGRKVLVFYYGVIFFHQQQVWNIKELDRINRKNSGTE